MEDFLWELKTERFLNGDMTPDEVVAFEQEQASNDELRAYVSLSIQLKEALSEDTWISYKTDPKNYERVKAMYKEPDVIAFKEKIQQADKEFTNTSPLAKKRFVKKAYWYAAAAMLAICISITYPLLTKPNLDTLYTEYATWDDMPTFIVQNQTQKSLLEELELAFQRKDYATCIIKADLVLNKTTQKNANVLIYKGVSLLELNKFDNALHTFQTLSNSDSLDASKGLWYEAMVYLKTKNTQKLRETLRVISTSSSNYNYKKALELLNVFE